MKTIDDTGTFRERAATRVQEHRDFFGHLTIYLVVNALLITIWAIASPDGLFWPIIILVGWGLGLVVHAWDAFMGPEISEADMAHEIDRMHRRSSAD